MAGHPWFTSALAWNASLDAASAPTLLYPYWHQLKTASDRLSGRFSFSRPVAYQAPIFGSASGVSCTATDSTSGGG